MGDTVSVSLFFTTFVAMKHFGLIGYPLGHSASAVYFTDKFSREAIDAEYTLYEIENITALDSIKGGLSGFNVTIPHKKAVIPYLATISPEAEAIGAVNCVKVDSKGLLHGYNTDVVGIRATLSPYDLCGQRAIILGTGGAAAAVKYVLSEIGMETTTVSRRSAEGVLCYSEITEELIASVRLIVNATPVGMFPNIDNAPLLPYHAIDKSHILFDLIYNPAQTRFLALGAAQGATTIGGGEMFRRQAEASWEIWSAKDEF